MKKIFLCSLIILVIHFFGCTNPDLNEPKKDTAIFSSEAPAVESPCKEEFASSSQCNEISIIGNGFINSLGEHLDILPDKRSFVKEYLELSGGRKVYEYFVDYSNDFLVIYDSESQTIEPFFNLTAMFESWDNIQVEHGPSHSILILCKNQIWLYNVDSKELQSNYIEVIGPEEWTETALVAMQYDNIKKQYVVAFTKWEEIYTNQTHELMLAVFDENCKEIERHFTNTPALRDAYVVWSIPFIHIEGDNVIFRTFSQEFAEQYSEFESKRFGIQGATKSELNYYVDFALSNYFEYSYNLNTEQLNRIQNVDPFENIRWNLAKYSSN